MRKLLSRKLFLVLVGLLVSPLLLSAKSYKLTILHTNDHHGHFEKFNPYPVVDVGGFAAQSTLINVVRAEVSKKGGHVLVLSAGDVNTGIPESDLQKAEPDIKLMNYIGYDAMTLGNHEFDNSREVLMKQKSWAKFPFLSANIYYKGTEKRLVEPYIIKDFDGFKVAILGLTTEKTPILTLPDNVADLEFRSALETAKKLVPELRQKADLVIALTHLGYYENSENKGDIALAKAVPGIDIIVGGHTHTDMEKAKIVSNTVIVQAGGYSESVGRIDLSFDTDSSKIAFGYQLLPVNQKKRTKYNGQKFYTYVGQGYVEDKGAIKIMKPYLEVANELLSKPIGETAVALAGGKSDSRQRETNLGNLITDSMRVKTGADIAIQNGGGIRSGIAPGKITYRDALSVQPFGNTLVLININGSKLIDVLSYAATKVGSGAFPQVSGIEYTIDNGLAKKIKVNGEPIKLTKTYKLVTNNFMAAGGDGYKMLKDLPAEDTGFVDADAFAEYVGKMKVVSPKTEGRITIIK